MVIMDRNYEVCSERDPEAWSFSMPSHHHSRYHWNLSGFYGRIHNFSLSEMLLAYCCMDLTEMKKVYRWEVFHFIVF